MFQIHPNLSKFQAPALCFLMISISSDLLSHWKRIEQRHSAKIHLGMDLQKTLQTRRSRKPCHYELGPWHRRSRSHKWLLPRHDPQGWMQSSLSRMKATQTSRDQMSYKHDAVTHYTSYQKNRDRPRCYDCRGSRSSLTFGCRRLVGTKSTSWSAWSNKWGYVDDSGILWMPRSKPSKK